MSRSRRTVACSGWKAQCLQSHSACFACHRNNGLSSDFCGTHDIGRNNLRHQHRELIRRGGFVSDDDSLQTHKSDLIGRVKISAPGILLGNKGVQSIIKPHIERGRMSYSATSSSNLSKQRHSGHSGSECTFGVSIRNIMNMRKPLLYDIRK
jgi:hypothetical protein